jgi:acetyltransferase-like isoleucine patch superfamily enzyme
MSAIPTSRDLGSAAPQAERTSSWYLNRALREPGRAAAVLLALLRGHWYKGYYRLRGVRFRAGEDFRVFGSLSVRGPGEVVFGDHVVVGGKATPWTHDPNARIVVGDNVMMGATRFGCVCEIVIGRDCILAEASIMDSDFHSVHVDRHSDTAPVRVAPVHIAENVWISQGAAVLAGTRIGKNSVVGFGAVCMRAYPENVIIMGNPAKVVAPVPGTGAVGAGATAAAAFDSSSASHSVRA